MLFNIFVFAQLVSCFCFCVLKLYYFYYLILLFSVLRNLEALVIQGFAHSSRSLHKQIKSEQTFRTRKL